MLLAYGVVCLWLYTRMRAARPSTYTTAEPRAGCMRVLRVRRAALTASVIQ